MKPALRFPYSTTIESVGTFLYFDYLKKNNIIRDSQDKAVDDNPRCLCSGFTCIYLLSSSRVNVDYFLVGIHNRTSETGEESRSHAEGENGGYLLGSLMFHTCSA